MPIYINLPRAHRPCFFEPLHSIWKHVHRFVGVSRLLILNFSINDINLLMIENLIEPANDIRSLITFLNLFLPAIQGWCWWNFAVSMLNTFECPSFCHTTIPICNNFSYFFTWITFICHCCFFIHFEFVIGIGAVFLWIGVVFTFRWQRIVHDWRGNWK